MLKIKLSAVQRRILEEIDLKPDITREVVAKVLRLKTASVHYAINTLLERKALVRRARINFFALGLTDVAVFFSVTESGKGGRRALEKWLIAHEQIAWLSRLAGEYQYALILFARSLNDVGHFIRELKSFQGILVGDLIVAPRTSYKECNRKYLTSKPAAPRTLAFEATGNSWLPDDLDHRLLSHLGHHEFDSMRSVARKLGIPVSTVEHRIAMMRQRGVLLGFYYEPVPSMFGMQAFRFLISTCGAPLDMTTRFERFCLRHPRVVFVIQAIGSWEYEIGIEVDDASLALEFASEISDFFGIHLRTLRTIQEVQDLKWNFYPFRENPFEKSA
jgi:DNA-binding Lrp family transcriptional regulator